MLSNTLRWSAVALLLTGPITAAFADEMKLDAAAPRQLEQSINQGQAQPLFAASPSQGPGMSQEHIQSLFFEAARDGRNDLLDGLLNAGMPVDIRNKQDYTALILAAYHGQAGTVDLLIKRGADACAADRAGNTSVMGAAFNGETKVVERLIDAHCDVNARNQVGQTALMMAALFGRSEVVRVLLAHGADPALRDKSGHTAVTLVREQGNADMLALLDDAHPGAGASAQP
jgi:hypothetical protein